MHRSDECRYDRRLYGLHLVAQRMSCPEIAKLLGGSPLTFQYRAARFEQCVDLMELQIN